MRIWWRKWGVTAMAWVAVLGIGGAALAGGEDDPPAASATLSPDEVSTGKTLASGEAFEMTLHLTADADKTYDLTILYAEDGVGTCQTDVDTLETNPEGTAAWTCAFDTAENPGPGDLTGTVTFDVTDAGAPVAQAVATLTVTPAQEEEEVVEEEPIEEETPEPETAGDENHGHCVSFWAHESKEAGLTGSARGAFISSIARDESAVAPKDDPESSPSCDFRDELDEAVAAQETENAKPAKAKSHGKHANVDEEDEGSDE